jgi:two-component system, LytTR family, sensor histidine kinase LytS
VGFILFGFYIFLLFVPMNILNTKRENIIKLLVEKRWIWHFAFWCTYFTLESPSYFFKEHQPVNVWKLALIQDIAVMSLTYVIIFVWFPLFYNKKKYVFFVISIILNALFFSFIVGYLIKDQINSFITKVSTLPEITLLQSFLQGISITVLFSIFIVMAKLGREVFIKQYYDNEKRKMQLQSELNNLKAQLSPHFLFNTMNNFYGLAVEKSNKLPDLMLRLSDLMRYSLYETKNEFVSLESEIHFLLNYIELEKIRLEDTLQVTFNYNADQIKQYNIAPLLLIVFVENAFKHSRNSADEAIDIKIDLSIEDVNSMHFMIQNKYIQLSSLSEQGGLGIENVKKRLEVLYPNDLHTLEIIKNNSNYIINLNLNLSNV